MIPLDKETFEAYMERLLEQVEKVVGALDKKNKKPQNYLNGERLYDNQDVCLLLNISKRTLQRYRDNGLKYYTILHKTYYREKDLHEFIRRYFDGENVEKGKTKECNGGRCRRRSGKCDGRSGEAQTPGRIRCPPDATKLGGEVGDAINASGLVFARVYYELNPETGRSEFVGREKMLELLADYPELKEAFEKETNESAEVVGKYLRQLAGKPGVE